MLDVIAAVPRDGHPVDLQPLFFRLTFDTTMFLLFGDTVSALDWGQVAGQESRFARAFTVAQDYLAHRGRLGPFYWLLNDRTFRRACRTCHDFVDQAVDKALRVGAEKRDAAREGGGGGGGGGYVFLHALAEKTQDRKALRDQCFNVLLAGRDTTGCCLTWTFRLLARHQRVLDRLRREIADTCGLGADSRPPTRDDLKPAKMPYLSYVIKEGASSCSSRTHVVSPHPDFNPNIVLRLYPSVPVNSREVVRTTILPIGGGPDGKAPLLVKPGEAVGYCVYAMHRRKDLYGEDAEEFRPERWETGELKDIGWAYLPFNGGPRLCLGRKCYHFFS